MATGTAISPATGDVIRIELALEGKTITAARARVFGCGTAIDFARRVAAQAEGKTLAAARGLDESAIAALYDEAFPPHKTYLVGVVRDALRAALDASSLP